MFKIRNLLLKGTCLLLGMQIAAPALSQNPVPGPDEFQLLLVGCAVGADVELGEDLLASINRVYGADPESVRDVDSFLDGLPGPDRPGGAEIHDRCIAKLLSSPDIARLSLAGDGGFDAMVEGELIGNLRVVRAQCPETENFIKSINQENFGDIAARLIDGRGAGTTGINSQIVTVFDEAKLLQYENTWQEHIEAAFTLYAQRGLSQSEVANRRANILAEWNDICDLVTEMLADLDG